MPLLSYPHDDGPATITVADHTVEIGAEPVHVPQAVADTAEAAHPGLFTVEDDPAEAAVADGPPSKSAGKPEWVAWAEARGDLDADSKTKAELIATYGGEG